MSPALQIVVLFAAAAVSLAGGSEWSYADTAHWTGVCQKGTQQSPIDLSPLISQVTRYDKLTFTNYETAAAVSVVNNGHTVQLDIAKSTACVLSGGGLPGVYYLAQMHFHWGAEHTLQGRRLPLELHLVHYGKKFSGVPEASQQPQGLAVIGILFKESTETNKRLEPLIAELDKVDGKVSAPISMSLAPDQWFPQDLTAFYRYQGSLTTPGCNETVVWTVMMAPVPISKKQLDRFIALRADNAAIGSNYRPVQNLNGRVITTTQPLGSGVYRIMPAASLLLAVLTFII